MPRGCTSRKGVDCLGESGFLIMHSLRLRTWWVDFSSDSHRALKLSGWAAFSEGWFPISAALLSGREPHWASGSSIRSSKRQLTEWPQGGCPSPLVVMAQDWISVF